MPKGGLIEKRSIDYVPHAERHGKVCHLWPVWFSGAAHLATLAVGILGITLGGNLLWTALAVLAGCALGTIFMAFHSTQGPQLGLPQMIQSRPQFGYTGALLVWAVAMIAFIGFNAFNQVLAAQTVHQLASSVSATSPTVIIGFAVLAMAVAIIGYDTIHLAQRAFAYLMIALLTVFSVGAAFFLQLPPEQWDPAGFKAVPFLTELFAAASYQLSWSIYVSDYSRYLPNDVGVRSSFWWTYLGAYIGGIWMMLVGTVAAAAAPKLDVAAAMENAADSIIPGFGPILLTGALLGLICITSLNFYGASLTLLSVADTCKPLECTAGKRVASLVAAGSVSTILGLNASGDFVREFGDLLAVLVYLFTPWTAINLVDFYLVRKKHKTNHKIFNPRGMYGRWNWRGLIAYFVGFVVMIPFFSTGLYTGSVARALGGADVAMLVGLPVAGVVYLIACRSFNIEHDRHLAHTADLGLE